MEQIQQEQADSIARLERELQQIQELLLEKYIQMGKSLYEIADRNVEEINALTDRLVSVKRTLSVNLNEIECPVCTAMVDRESSYCKRCGAKLEHGKESEA